MAKNKPYQKPFKADKHSGWIWDKNTMHALDVRGWGHLTGGGAMNIPEKRAAVIQDAFQKHVVDALNAYKEFTPPKED
jgi:hypothetical protein